MPDTIVTSYPEERDQVTTVRRLTLTSPAAVTTSHQEPSTRALLSALTGVRRNEQLIVQVTLGHRLPPRLVPRSPRSSTNRRFRSCSTASSPSDARQPLPP